MVSSEEIIDRKSLLVKSSFSLNGKTLLLGRGVEKGIASGLSVRAGAFIVQLFGIPIAFHALGHERFGLLLMLAGLGQWAGLGNLGMKAALARFISGGMVRADINRCLGASLLLALCSGASVVVILGTIIFFWLLKKPPDSLATCNEVVLAAFVLLALLLIKAVVVTFHGVQVGHLKTHRVNFFQLIGQFSRLCLLLAAAYLWPHLAGFVIAMVGGLLIGDILNAWEISRKYRPAFAGFSELGTTLGQLVKAGLSYSIIDLVAAGSSGFLVFLVGAIGEPQEAAIFGVMMRLWMMVAGVLAIINIPLWPALRDALYTGNRDWAVSAIRRFFWIEGSIGLTLFLVLGPGAPSVLGLWLQENIVITQSYAILYAIVILQGTFVYYWGIVLMGFGEEKLVAFTHAARFIVLLSTGAFLIPYDGGRGAMASLCLAYLVAETFCLPLMVRRKMKCC